MGERGPAQTPYPTDDDVSTDSLGR